MEDVTKDSGHRPSVSMPSLDAVDDFPTQTIATEENKITSFVSTDSCISTAESTTSTKTVETLEPAGETINSFTEENTIAVAVGDISAENSQSVEAFSADLIEHNSEAVPVESDQPQSFEQGIREQAVIESDPLGAPSEELIEPKTTEEVALTDGLEAAESDDLRSEVLDESQVEEDPSIAIDQFIKKIADEQLSSKRIEERKEEEAQEHTSLILSDKVHIAQEENILDGGNLTEDVSEKPEFVGTSVQGSSSEAGSALDESVTQDKTAADEAAVEPMEVDSDTPKIDVKASQPKEQTEEPDNMEAESIEEIQKEIMKIPPKKTKTNEEPFKPADTVKEEVTSNGTHSEEENIAQIFGTEETKDTKAKILKAALESEFPTPTIEDSAEVAKDSRLIEKAKEEIRKLDVLVCGECHSTFYYIADFAEHKQGGCSQKQATKDCESEGRPQVWGFMLWKVKQTMDYPIAPSAWSLYQKWCKLPQDDKEAWITAGQAIQFASKIGAAKVTEIKPTKAAKQTTVQRVVSVISPSKEFDSNKENSTIDLDNSVSNVLGKGVPKREVKLNNDLTLIPSAKIPQKAPQIITAASLLSTPNSSAQKDEFVVEKIMAKRFNPRKKTWEYNIKWEHFGHDSNTWEPVSNLSHCKKMLEQFEEQLKKMKEEKAKQAAQSAKLRGRPSNPKPNAGSPSNYVPIAPKGGILPTISNIVGGVSEDYGGVASNRPQRSCKQKAMNQVKEWCGNISDEEAGGTKRKHETDESDDDFDDKRIKLEDDSDFSDKEIKPKPTPVKKVSITPVKPLSKQAITVKNGNNSQQILPSNILIPDANGVVRINQKQLPSLSSGVYIMSKTAGIIKLDSTTSKVATSGGQTIVKVAPKVGQTQIKIVKKDGSTTKQIIQVASKNTGSLASPIKIAPKPSGMVTSTPNRVTPQLKIRKEIKREAASRVLQKKILAPVKEVPPKPKEPESDSDDGLEPLPFPSADEPIPDIEEETEPEAFVLDPETGKMAGVEYVDKPVVIKEEPKRKPLSSTSSELENIVKMAAADLSDDDLHNSDSMDESMLSFVPEVKEVKIEPKQEPPTFTRKVPKYVPAQNQSILNKSLTQGPRKPLVAPAAKPVTPLQRRMVAKMPTIVPQRALPAQPRTVVRHVIEPSRLGGNVNVIRKTVTSTPKPRTSMPMQKTVASPVQPARTYSAMGGIRQSNAGNKVQVFSSKSNVAASHAPNQMQGGVRRIGNTIVRSTSNQVTPQRQHPVQQKQPLARIVQRPITSPVKKPMMQQITKSVSPVKPKTIISMPSLTDELTSSPKPQPVKPAPVQKPIAAPKPAPPVIKQEPVMKMEVQETVEEPAATSADATDVEQTDWSTFTMADGEDPIYVTGDDGTIYQVAGRNEQGQTILITQGPDGQQQCLLVTNEISEMTADEPQPSTSATAGVAAPVETTESAITTTLEAPAQAEIVAPLTLEAPMEQSSLHTPLQIKTDTADQEMEDDDGMQDQVVAQVVRAEPPSPGGTHKVVVMLPDGNLMVTKVSPEEFASLELE